jgi:tyrosine-protein phosphatase SIW14
MGMVRKALPWILGAVLATLILGLPGLHYRYTYEQSKRLRVVTDGKFYRSGQLPASGFRDAAAKYGIKTVINLQEEARDPLIPERAFAKPSVRQSDALAAIGVNAIALDGGVLEDNPQPGQRPAVIDEFLEVIDAIRDKYWKNDIPHAVLIHCKAGLHRTGLLTAIYRLEYEDRSLPEVIEELKANGFGTYAATDANDYIRRFLIDYRKGLRWPGGKPAKPSVKPDGGKT